MVVHDRLRVPSIGMGIEVAQLSRQLTFRLRFTGCLGLLQSVRVVVDIMHNQFYYCGALSMSMAGIRDTYIHTAAGLYITEHHTAVKPSTIQRPRRLNQPPNFTILSGSSTSVSPACLTSGALPEPPSLPRLSLTLRI